MCLIYRKVTILTAILFYAAQSIVQAGGGGNTDDKKVGGIHVVVKNLKSAKGQLLVAVFNSKSGFPDDASKAYWKKKAKLDKAQYDFVIPHLPPGNYAVVVVHDEDGDGKMQKSIIGMPKEGVGISRCGSKIEMMKKPNYQESAIMVENQVVKESLRINYF